MKARHPKAPLLPSYPGLRIVSDEIVWDGRFPLQRVRFHHRRFDGGESGLRTWELWRRGAAVAVLPYDPNADRVALIEQFRLPALAAGLDPIVTECAAGFVDPGETPEDAARREAEEETGLTPARLERMGRWILTQGGCDETMTCYCACTSLPAPGIVAHHGVGHEHEDIRLKVLAADEAFAMLDDNRINNATAALALFWLRANRGRLRREWTGAAPPEGAGPVQGA
jgi:ADP-ribose pyrophosphatase